MSVKTSILILAVQIIQHFLFLLGRFGLGSGPIWLDQVVCTGTEYFIQDCDHDDFGENDCTHTEDVGVVCLRELLHGVECILVVL